MRQLDQLKRLEPHALALPGFWKRLACLALTLAFVAAGAATADAETRVALVIGNGAYREIATLANPPNDARDVAAELKTLGFKVTTGVDLDQASMEREIAEFAKAAAAADVSLFYYGGHGLQVAAHNFLIPVDAQLHNEDDIYNHTVHFDEILKTQEQGKGIHLVFLDACRTNPMKDALPFPACRRARPRRQRGWLSHRLCDAAR